MKRWICVSLCTLLAAGMSAGCGTKVTSDTSLVYVDKKGGVTSIDVETLNKGYYNEEELKDDIEEVISDYTKEHGKGTVSLKDLTVEGQQAKLTMKYKTASDYAALNGIEFYQGKIVKALAAGYDFKTDFASVEDGKITGSASVKDIYESGDLKAVVIKASTDVQVEGEIRYVSAPNVEVTGNNSVSIRAGDSGSQEEEPGTEALSPAGTEQEDAPYTAYAGDPDEPEAYAYIIYK